MSDGHLAFMEPWDNGGMRVLVVEDELRMASLIRRGLLEEGLSGDVAATGEDALWMAAAADYDAIVLDVMLPGIDGFETCRRLRTSGVWAPVLMLTARDSVEDQSVLDFDMLQTGHSDRASIPNTVRRVTGSLPRAPKMLRRCLPIRRG